MNKTKIEWADYTWNPVTGCWGPGGSEDNPRRCFYCYVPPIYRRFKRSFEPTFHPERLSDPGLNAREPRRIFVCSTGDLLGPWVHKDWIQKVIYVAMDNPRHTFMFLTKNPAAYKEFEWPDNAWLGATVTDRESWDAAMRAFDFYHPVKFVSCEPLLGPINPEQGGHRIDWIIIGQMTGRHARYYRTSEIHVTDLIIGARRVGKPLFLKNNLNWPKKIQEWPI